MADVKVLIVLADRSRHKVDADAAHVAVGCFDVAVPVDNSYQLAIGAPFTGGTSARVYRVGSDDGVPVETLPQEKTSKSALGPYGPYGVVIGDPEYIATEIASWDATPPSEEPKAEGDECVSAVGDKYTDEELDRLAIEYPTSGAGFENLTAAIKRRNARIRELAAQVERLSNEPAVAFEMKRLRAKCSRQRKELKRLNFYAKTHRQEVGKLYTQRNEERARNQELKAELAELRGREEPREAWARCIRELGKCWIPEYNADQYPYQAPEPGEKP
jgi:hypothetical protein